MMRAMFFLAMMAIPFSGVPGWDALGEARHELSAYLFLVTLVLAAPRLIREAGMGRVYLLPKTALLFFAVIGVSFLANATTIMDNTYLGRAGSEKFFSSCLMAAYGFMLAYLAYFVGDSGLKNMILRPIAASVAICILFSFFEILFWFHVGAGFFEPVSDFIHSGYGWQSIGSRLRSVSYEPPAFAVYAAFAWPWLYAGFRNGKGGAKALYLALWLALNVMMVLAMSRIGFVTLAGLFFALAALRWGYMPPHVAARPAGPLFTFAIFCIAAAGGIALAINFDRLSDAVISGANISNLSRLASNVAAFKMFFAHPLFGLGFGQYGFYAAQFMPDWGYDSWEVRGWLGRGDNHFNAWPPVFSVYARFGAELGIAGIAAWIFIWCRLAYEIWKASMDYRRIHGLLPFQAAPLILCCLCVLLTGISNDSLRTPMIWITLGLGCRFLYDMRLVLSFPVFPAMPLEAVEQAEGQREQGKRLGDA